MQVMYISNKYIVTKLNMTITCVLLDISKHIEFNIKYITKVYIKYRYSVYIYIQVPIKKCIFTINIFNTLN